MKFFFMAVVGGIIHFTFSLRWLDLLLFPAVIGAVEAPMDGDVCVLVPAGHLSRHLPRQVGLRIVFLNHKLIKNRKMLRKLNQDLEVKNTVKHES
jgi:hypothetical protein